VFRVLHDKGLELDCTYNKPELRALNMCSERPLRWLWKDKIPLGKLTLIEGPPAVGKLFVALDIAARVSTEALLAEKDWSPCAAPACVQSAAGAEAASPVQPPPSDSVFENANEPQGASGTPREAGENVEMPATANSDAPDQPGLRIPRADDRAQCGSGTRESSDEDLASLLNSHEFSYGDVNSPGQPTPAAPEPPLDSPADSGQSVVLLCDSWQAEDMIAPRLRMLGAREERIIMFTEVDCTDQCGGHRHPRPIQLPLDRPMFEYILRQHRGCRLIVIDDLESYCDSPRQLRQAIRELDETANYFGVAIVATLQGNVRFAPDGAIRDPARTIDGLARCIWCVTPDPVHPGLLRLEPKRMAFCKKPEGIAFRISDAGQVVWEALPPREKPPTEAARRKEKERARMLTWLGTTLGTGVVLAETIYDAGKEQGYSKKKLIEARDELGARTFKYGFGKAGAWMWTLKPPSEVTDAEIQAAYLHLPEDFPADLKEALEQSVPGREGIVAEDDEGIATGESPASAAQESENSGVLSEKSRKNAGFRTSRRGRKRSRSYDGLSLPQLRELGMQKLGLSRPPRHESPEGAARHIGNGHSGNGRHK
jgi:hypothetical protein